MASLSKRQKRRSHSRVATLMRAIVLEGAGVIVLIFLLTVSTADPVRADSESGSQPVLQKIRNWIDRSWSVGRESRKNVSGSESPDAPMQRTVKNQPFPQSFETQSSQFQVKRAVGYE